MAAGALMITCDSCQRKLLAKRATTKVNGVVQLEATHGEISKASIFPVLLRKLFGEKCTEEALKTSDDILENFLLLEVHDSDIPMLSDIVSSAEHAMIFRLQKNQRSLN